MNKKSKQKLNNIILEEIIRTSLMEQDYLPKPEPSDRLGSGGDFERQQRAMYPPIKLDIDVSKRWPKIDTYKQRPKETKDEYFDRMYGTNPVVTQLLAPKGTGSEYDHANKTLQIIKKKKIPISIFLEWARNQWDSNLLSANFDGKYMVIDRAAPHLMGKTSWVKFYKALLNYDITSNDPVKFGNALKDFSVGVQIISYGQSNLHSALYLIRRNQDSKSASRGYMYFTFSYNNPSNASPNLSVAFKLRKDKLWLSSGTTSFGFLTKSKLELNPFKSPWDDEREFKFSKWGPGGHGVKYYDRWTSQSGWDLFGLLNLKKTGEFIRFYPQAHPDWEIGAFDKDNKAYAQGNQEWYDHIYKITPELRKQYPDLDQSHLDHLLAAGDWIGLMFPPADIAMSITYFSIGRPIEGTISLIGAIPLFGDAIQLLYKGGKRLINGTKAIKHLKKTKSIADIEKRIKMGYDNLNELKKLDKYGNIPKEEYQDAVKILNDLEAALKAGKSAEHTAEVTIELMKKRAGHYAKNKAGRELFHNVIIKAFSSPTAAAALIKTEQKAAQSIGQWIKSFLGKFGRASLDVVSGGSTIIVRKAFTAITKHAASILKYSRVQAVRGLKIAETRFLKLATNDSTFTAIAMHGFTGGTKTKIFKRAGDDIFKNKEFMKILKKKYGIKGKFPLEALQKRLLEDTDEIMKLWKSTDESAYKFFINDNTTGLTGLLQQGGKGYIEGSNHFFTAFSNQSLYKILGFASPPGIWKNTSNWNNWSNFIFSGDFKGIVPVLNADLFKDAAPLIYNEMIELYAALKGDENLSEQSVIIALMDNILMTITNKMAGYKFVGYRGLLEQVHTIKSNLAPISQMLDNQKERNEMGVIDWDPNVPLTQENFIETYQIYWSKSIPYDESDDDLFKKLKEENPKAYEASMMLKLKLLESWAERGWITPMTNSYSKQTGLAERWIVAKANSGHHARFGLVPGDVIDIRKWTPGGIGDREYNAIFHKLKDAGKFTDTGLLQPKPKPKKKK